MGIHRGPNMEKGGLLFGYDSGHGVCDNHTSSRFYRGKPTTNYLSDGLSGYNVVQGSRWNGATPTYTLGNSEFNTPIGTYNTSGTSYMYSHDYVLDDDLSTLSSQVVTFSIYLRRTNTLGTVGMRIYDNVSGYSTIYADVTNQFQRFSMTKTLGANPTRIFVMIDNTNGGVIDFHSPMLEKGEASPFVDGTRLSTDSLIDLTKSTDIDVSDVSFNSTGQPTFDGTNDSVVIGNVGGYSNQMTCEAVFKTSSGASWKNMLCGATGDIIFTVNVAQLNFGSQGSNPIPHANYSTTSVNDGKLHHGVATYDGSQVKIYVDGVLESTNNRSGNQTPGSLRVGSNQTGSSEFFNGDLPVVKLYGRALSIEEVQQNFNTYKKRFNI
jgi:hypothetical protein